MTADGKARKSALPKKSRHLPVAAVLKRAVLRITSAQRLGVGLATARCVAHKVPARTQAVGLRATETRLLAGQAFLCIYLRLRQGNLRVGGGGNRSADRADATAAAKIKFFIGNTFLVWGWCKHRTILCFRGHWLRVDWKNARNAFNRTEILRPVINVACIA